jgi:hypothetical protein
MLVFFGFETVFKLFDLSWIDDALQTEKPLCLLLRALFGFNCHIFGANVESWPGWWCYICRRFGNNRMVYLSLFLNKFSQVFERITMKGYELRFRFGSYLLASGLIWEERLRRLTSFYMTIEEFLVGWPV